MQFFDDSLISRYARQIRLARLSGIWPLSWLRNLRRSITVKTIWCKSCPQNVSSFRLCQNRFTFGNTLLGILGTLHKDWSVIVTFENTTFPQKGKLKIEEAFWLIAECFKAWQHLWSRLLCYQTYAKEKTHMEREGEFCSDDQAGAKIQANLLISFRWHILLFLIIENFQNVLYQKVMPMTNYVRTSKNYWHSTTFSLKTQEHRSNKSKITQ